ncbi:MAG: serine/threonine protein kinase, partial [Lentisphaeria bacterium]|nr:serine/threonine protein kinase [Lentisphaeria bacterium]
MTDELDKTIPPQRPRAVPEDFMDLEKTMAPRRERKTDGRIEAGDLIMGRYNVLAELGQGGMGVVYKCFDEIAGIEVVLKALPPELSHNTLEMEDIKDNFQLVHNLHHPNIASSNTLEKNPENGNYYLIMECCEGEDLRRWIRRKHKDRSMTWDEFLSVIRQVADALDYAHKQRLMHRDIKPGNIMIDGAGKVKVLDFGLAAQIHTSMTRVSMAYRGTSGTGPYMAPEQWRGHPQGAAADQYALAVMAYE